MDSIINQSGPCGCFQVIHVFLTQSNRFLIVWSLYFMMFGNFDPGWRCISRDVMNQTNYTTTDYSSDGNESTIWSSWSGHGDVLINNNRTPRTGSDRMRNGDVDIIESLDYTASENSSNTSDSNTYNDKCDVIDTCQGIVFNPESSTIVSEFGLVCEKTWVLSLIIFMQYVGMMAGCLLWGQIGERYGRKVSVYVSTALMGLANACAVFSPTWEVYLVCTVFIGVGGVGVLSCVPVLTVEFLSPKWRGIYASIPTWNVSTCLFVAMAILLKDWRHLHIANTVLIAIVCLGYFWVPESVRWLAIHAKTDKAIKVVRKMSRYNRKPMPDISAIETLAVGEKNYTYMDLFRSRDTMIIIVKTSILLIIAICSYNALGFGVYSLPGNFYVNLIISSLVELPAVLLIGILANGIGRRWTAFSYSALMTFCCISIVISSLVIENRYTADMFVTVLAFVARGSATAILGLISPMIIELLPTVVRSVGLGFVMMTSRLGGLAASFLLPHDDTSFLVCFSVLALTGVTSCLVFLSLPETNKKPLRDMMSEKEPMAGNVKEPVVDFPVDEVDELIGQNDLKL